jgi:hypothetical protein
MIIRTSRESRMYIEEGEQPQRRYASPSDMEVKYKKYWGTSRKRGKQYPNVKLSRPTDSEAKV